jgi:hypothetical protein
MDKNFVMGVGKARGRKMPSGSKIDEEFKHRCDLLAEIFEDCSDFDNSYFVDVEGMKDILSADMAWYIACAVSYDMVSDLTKLGRDGVDYIWRRTIDAIGLTSSLNYQEFSEMRYLLEYAGIIYEDEEE